MNEQIRELVKQAGGHFSTQTLTSHPVQYRESVGLWDDKIEKFAELMVIEFTETVKQTATRIAQTGFNDGLSMEEVNQRVNAALTVLEVVRERFGVKE